MRPLGRCALRGGRVLRSSVEGWQRRGEGRTGDTAFLDVVTGFEWVTDEGVGFELDHGDVYSDEILSTGYFDQNLTQHQALRPVPGRPSRIERGR